MTPDLFGCQVHHLSGEAVREAKAVVIDCHYTKSVPSGKSWWFRHNDALVCYSIPANKNIGSYLIGTDEPNAVLELARLWAPNSHKVNELTKAISSTVKMLKTIEPVQALVSFADPNIGHHGGVYQAASWVYCGQSDEGRAYKSPNGDISPRRKFRTYVANAPKLQSQRKG